ncbi:MAG TPA: hydantoinase/oxoprolinase family protein, partial [Planctomycetes bacterium]|nr:hydantoinase/oxoprolinase family protein [Planctomycetota bacterium]
MARSPETRAFGIDAGGTFTDFAYLDGGELRVLKVPSTPHDPSEAVLRGLERAGGVAARDHVIHGTTVALNALLTGNGARVALVTNEGFRDLIEIGRQERPDIYALVPERAAPLVPRELRFEVPQRSWPAAGARRGEGRLELEEVRAPTSSELERLARRVRAARPEAIAICLLSSFADPGIERRVADALAPLGVPITLSAELLAEHREVERFSTAIVNAALQPLVARYLDSLARGTGARLSILQSSGGTMDAARAAREPARILFSGPAGGVVAAARAAREAGLDAFCGLDMGGTSTDVSFHDPAAAARGSAHSVDPVRVAGQIVSVPSLDLHTIGCGGGSVVRIDAAGVLHVGPESAGADPGPIATGGGPEPTVTDAHVLLGHLAGGRFLGGELELDVDGVRRAFEDLGKRLGTTAERAAMGVLEVARAAMRRAIGVMTLQRGGDPERISLVAFGGAGGLHAADLAANLRMVAALVPRHPGVLSAIGMVCAEPSRDLVRSALVPLEAWKRSQRRRVFAELAREGRASLREGGVAARSIRVENTLDLRYRGQSFEIQI